MLPEADERARATSLARILVVDDEQRILRFVVRGLQAEGYEVDSADSGTEGLRKALNGQYDLVRPRPARARPRRCPAARRRGPPPHQPGRWSPAPRPDPARGGQRRRPGATVRAGIPAAARAHAA